MEVSLYQKEWRLKNREKLQAYYKTYRRNNLESRKAYERAWRFKNKDRLRIKNKLWQQNNPEKCRASWRRYASKPHVKERLRLTNRIWSKESFNRRMARRYGVTEDLIRSIRKSPCEICGGIKRIVLDHDPISGRLRGGLCNVCNTSLGKMGDNSSGVRKALEYLLNAESRDAK